MFEKQRRFSSLSRHTSPGTPSCSGIQRQGPSFSWESRRWIHTARKGPSLRHSIALHFMLYSPTEQNTSSGLSIGNEHRNESNQAYISGIGAKASSPPFAAVAADPLVRLTHCCGPGFLCAPFPVADDRCHCFE